MNEQPPVTPYVPEKPDYIRTAVKTLIALLIFHGLSLVFHFMVLGRRASARGALCVMVLPFPPLGR